MNEYTPRHLKPENHLFIEDDISDELFQKLSGFILREYGIVLNLKKRALVVHRIAKRLHDLELSTVNEYVHFIFSNEGIEERSKLGEVFSTNKTYFFREEQHFEFITSLLKNTKTDKYLSIWSAGCSTGEEVFTMAMILQEIQKVVTTNTISYSIWGTDISAKALSMARERVYHENQLWCTPNFYRNKYFKKSENSGGFYYEMEKGLLRNVSFEYFNLTKRPMNFSKKFDIIFCRNVIIYFNEETKKRVVQQLVDSLNPNGYLILSLTEGAVGSSLGLNQVAPSIFQKA